MQLCFGKLHVRLLLGLSLSLGASQASTNLLDIAYGHGRFVAVGNPGYQSSAILVSADGSHWTNQSPGLHASLSAVAFGNGTFVAVGQTVLMTSTNGLQWAVR